MQLCNVQKLDFAGLAGDVMFDGKVVTDWTALALDFDEDFLEKYVVQFNSETYLFYKYFVSGLVCNRLSCWLYMYDVQFYPGILLYIV